MTTRRPDSCDAPTLKGAIRLARRLLPPDGNPETFLKNLSKERGRPLQLIEMELGGPSGMYVGLPTMDVVLVEVGSSPSRRLASLAHEAAHMLLGHDKDSTHVEDSLTTLLPNLSPSIIRQALLRQHHDGQQESDAEQLATIISSELSVRAALYDLDGHPVSRRLR